MWTEIALLSCLVVGVSDGDSLTLRCASSAAEQRVRLATIDAPELLQPYGRQARQALRERVYRQPVQAVCTHRDRYQRALCTVRSEAHGDLGLTMVRLGWAWCYPDAELQTGAQTETPCMQAEHLAREERRGLWRDGPAQPPWLWRRAHNRR
jgi:endonuclease YncB( thermonuclease family)